MSHDISNKRKLEDEELSENKKIRQESPDSVVDDLNYLKESIKQEIFKVFDERFHNLENEIKELKRTIGERSGDSFEKKDGGGYIKTPPDVSNSSTSHSTRLHPLSTINNKAQKLQANNTSDNAVLSKPDDSGKQNTAKHTFGGKAYLITTPTNSFITSTNPADTPTAPNTAQSSPKHVFGATSSFGNSAFDIKSKRNVFDGLSSKVAEQSDPNINGDAGKPVSSASASSSFGSNTFGNNSKFGNAFQNSLKKKSFLDNKNEDNEEELSSKNTRESNTPEKTPATQQYKQVDLTPVQEIKTGEENEQSHFIATAKIFELDLSKISDGWKERGLGRLHLNQSLSDIKQVRLVMRSQGLLRVVLNMKVTSETKLFKGLEASLTPGKFVRMNSVNDKGIPVQYLLKFGNETIRDELVEKVENLQEVLIESKDGENKDSTGSTEKPKAQTGVKWL